MLRGEFFQTGFANLLAWRDWDYPDQSVNSCFAAAAIETADNGFLAGVMASHTANAGKVYFPTGMADACDLEGEHVNMDVSVRRELLEEAGLVLDDFKGEPEWHVVFSGQHIALIKWLFTAEKADELGSRVKVSDKPTRARALDVAFLYGANDLSSAVPPYVRVFLQQVWRSRTQVNNNRPTPPTQSDLCGG